MRNIVITTSLVFLFFLVYSCTPSPSEMIIGDWKITDIQTAEEIPEELAEIYAESMEEMKSSSLLVFNADSTFERTISETTAGGKWKISEDAKQLILTYEEGGEQEISTINEITETKLEVSMDINDDKKTIVYEKQISE